ncbi:response regulator [candidate division KSB3 bacterium]|uniref:Response regulator n=1 Tax=candidate division KSB3 bacterium TaxID=2044937 RepID=A0A9D5JY16_9BACT|nr:response regulator [candidate division KSB3 bacterium]MBD3326409.1 response regulator [candidate division KSB3 bacterium]
MTNLDILLLVEDEIDHANLIIEALREEGHLTNDIIWVKDGQQAIDYTYQQGEFADQDVATPGLILLDLKLPELNGFEVLKILKNDPEYHEIPIVVLTTSNNSEDVKTALKLNANDYIVKPVAWEDFERKIRELGKYWAFTSNASLAKG